MVKTEEGHDLPFLIAVLYHQNYKLVRVSFHFLAPDFANIHFLPFLSKKNVGINFIGIIYIQFYSNFNFLFYDGFKLSPTILFLLQVQT